MYLFLNLVMFAAAAASYSGPRWVKLLCCPGTLLSFFSSHRKMNMLKNALARSADCVDDAKRLLFLTKALLLFW
jgi:hypothetical protein